MNMPKWLDASELDESIAKLDAIAKPEPDILDVRINDALYWIEAALDRKAATVDIAALRAQATHDAFARIGVIIVMRELEKGRKYVEPQK
jgi:hypothetical protein